MAQKNDFDTYLAAAAAKNHQLISLETSTVSRKGDKARPNYVELVVILKCNSCNHTYKQRARVYLHSTAKCTFCRGIEARISGVH